jgi:hypothetical protein
MQHNALTASLVTLSGVLTWNMQHATCSTQLSSSATAAQCSAAISHYLSIMSARGTCNTTCSMQLSAHMQHNAPCSVSHYLGLECSHGTCNMQHAARLGALTYNTVLCSEISCTLVLGAHMEHATSQHTVECSHAVWSLLQRLLFTLVLECVAAP